MKYVDYVANSLDDTKALAKSVAKKLNGGDVVLLYGDLGAGKTMFTKFLASAFKIKDIVSSPTYTIMQNYKTKKIKLNHFDLYRLNSVEEGENFGLEDYILNRDMNSISVVEWPEKIENILRGEFIVIKIEFVSENSRKFNISRKTF